MDRKTLELTFANIIIIFDILFLLLVLDIVGVNQNYNVVGINGILSFLINLYLFFIYRREINIKPKHLLIFFIPFLLFFNYAFSIIVLNNDPGPIIQSMLLSAWKIMPSFFYGLFLISVNFSDKFLNSLKLSGNILTIITFIAYISDPQNFDYFGVLAGNSGAHLIIGYSLAFFIFINLSLNNSWFIKSLLFIIQVMMLFSTGAKGAILSAILIILYSIAKNFKKFIVITLILSLLITLFKEYILNLLVYFKYQSGVFWLQRILKFVNPDGSINFHEGSSDRDSIYNDSWASFEESPLWGMGSSYLGDQYAHNIFLELLSENGLIFTAIFLSILVILLMKNLTFNNKINYIIVGLALITFLYLMFSSSYRHSTYFWFLIPLLFHNSTKQIKNEKQDEN